MDNKAHTAEVTGRDLPVSTRQVKAISNFIRGKNLKKSQHLLDQVTKMKQAIPFTVHTGSVGHRRGRMASGRYPIKAVKEVINLLNSVEANAQNKGLNTDTLFISEIIPNMASRPWHFGRQRGTKMKRTHLKIIVEEKEPATKATRKTVKKTVKKVAEKKSEETKK